MDFTPQRYGNEEKEKHTINDDNDETDDDDTTSEDEVAPRLPASSLYRVSVDSKPIVIAQASADPSASPSAEIRLLRWRLINDYAVGTSTQ